MEKEVRTVVYDESLRIEACHFKGIARPFPNHFHEHYVIGYVESGERCLSCRNNDYTISPGAVVIFHPGDNHACTQTDAGTLDYRSFHISKEMMSGLAEEVTGRRELPGFSENVIHDEEVVCYLRPLHEMVMSGNDSFEKEETLLFLLSVLIQHYGQPFEHCIPTCRLEIETACNYMEQHFAEHISLDQICREAGLSRSALLRAFTKSKGITPYRHLETIRINEAEKLLSAGVPLPDAAIMTGFSDQSHFTNYFTSFTGLSPAHTAIFSCKKAAAGKSVIAVIRRRMNDMDLQNMKCVMIIDETLPSGVIASTAAIPGITPGKNMPEIVGTDVCDRTGQEHSGIIAFPVPILRGTADVINVVKALLPRPRRRVAAALNPANALIL